MQVAWTPTAKRALRLLPKKVGTAVIEIVYGPLADNPHRVGKALRLDFQGLYSARRGDFRVIYRVGNSLTIVAIEHRSDAYRPR